MTGYLIFLHLGNLGSLHTTDWSLCLVLCERHPGRRVRIIFFGQVCNSKATLVEFMTHYETAIEAQRHTHRKNDHESRYKRPQLKSNYQVLEGQAADIYTKNIFCDVQGELIGIADCINQRYEDQPDGFVKFYIKCHILVSVLVLLKNKETDDSEYCEERSD